MLWLQSNSIWKFGGICSRLLCKWVAIQFCEHQPQFPYSLGTPLQVCEANNVVPKSIGVVGTCDEKTCQLWNSVQLTKRTPWPWRNPIHQHRLVSLILIILYCEGYGYETRKGGHLLSGKFFARIVDSFMVSFSFIKRRIRERMKVVSSIRSQ